MTQRSSFKWLRRRGASQHKPMQRSSPKARKWCFRILLSAIPFLNQSHEIWSWIRGPIRALYVIHTQVQFTARCRKHTHTGFQFLQPLVHRVSVRTANLNSNSWKWEGWDGSKIEGGVRKQEVACWVSIGWRSGTQEAGNIGTNISCTLLFFFFLLGFHAVQW